MKPLLALPVALANGGVVWLASQVTSFDVSIAAAVTIGGVASIVPSAFMAWAAWNVRGVRRVWQDHVDRDSDWRARHAEWQMELVQRVASLETVVEQLTDLREEVLHLLDGHADHVTAKLTAFELKLDHLTKDGGAA